MKITVLRGGVDFYSGLLLVSIAAAALWYITSLEIGTALEMGPGYFPLGIALVLGGMGLFLLVRGLMVEGAPVGRIDARAMGLILLSFLAFALLLDRFGIVIAILAQVAIASLASREAVFWQSLIFGAVLAAGSTILFVWLLGIPVSVLP
ncbi:tripartite tricarboxylate transporter TctB family protein [Aquabacter sp. CN5-332]|uniref:tripartite tricarboxylate transporter TctB family protein n=1 Tax=Aquabacter sp. CN5-332 TaxID=3156608 RepID=UPI0032B562AC